MSGCDDWGDETNSILGTSRYVWEANLTNGASRCLNSGRCLTSLVRSWAGYDATQYSEKGNRKRPETTDFADRSSWRKTPTATTVISWELPREA